MSYGTPSPSSPGDGKRDDSLSERQILAIEHGANILPLVATLLVWFVFRERGPQYDREGKEAMNFGITLGLAWIAVGILNLLIGWIPVIGPLFTWSFTSLVTAVGILLALYGAFQAYQSGSYRYPFAVRFIR